MELNLKITGLNKVINFLNPQAQRTILMRTFNKLGDKIFTQSKRYIRDTYNVQVPQSSYKISKQKATPEDITFRLKADYQLINVLKYFKAKQNTQGLTFQIIKGGKTITIHSGFIATPHGRNYSKRGQSRQVAQGSPVPFKRIGKSAYPLALVTGLSFGKMIDNKKILKQDQDLVDREGPGILQHEIDFYLSSNKRD